MIKVAKIEYWDGTIFYISDPTDEKLRTNIKAVKEYFGPEKLRQFEIENKQCTVTELMMDESEYNSIPATNFGSELYKTERQINKQEIV